MADAKVKARVIRGSFNWRKEDGTVEEILPGNGEASKVMVTKEQLAAFSGVMVADSEADAAMADEPTESNTAPDPSPPPSNRRGR